MVPELVATTPSGLLGMVECRGPRRPFHCLRVGRYVRLFDHPDAFIGRDLRESSDPPSRPQACRPIWEAMRTGEPVVEDIEGAVQFADGRIHEIAYRCVLLRVAGTANGGAIVTKTSQHLRPCTSVGK